jgi:hypothetical protein
MSLSSTNPHNERKQLFSFKDFGKFLFLLIREKQQCFYDFALYAYLHTYADGWDEKSSYHTDN